MEELIKRGFTQKELAEYINIPSNSMTEWKAGRSKSYQKHLPKIAEFLGVSADYLIDNEKPSDKVDRELTEYLEVLKNRPEMKMLFSLAKGATKEDVEQAVKIIEALRGK